MTAISSSNKSLPTDYRETFSSLTTYQIALPIVVLPFTPLLLLFMSLLLLLCGLFMLIALLHNLLNKKLNSLYYAIIE